MTKVLIVIDGDFVFDPPNNVSNDFTFVTLVNALVSGGYDVTKANRSPDGTATAGFASFTFNNLAQLLPFGVIWLLGRAGRNSQPNPASTDSKSMPDSELAVLSAYMDAGGGVFAVGDHDSIGSVMCGQLPRVRAMRSWYGDQDGFARCGNADAIGTEGANWTGQAHVPANFPQLTILPSTGRADTMLAGPSSVYPAGPFTPYLWFENQSDSRPQTIAPATSPTHPILRSGGADITVYPDHMHEGQTLGDGDIPGWQYDKILHFNGQAFTEFPPIGGMTEKPKVIATGHSHANKSLFANSGSAVDQNVAGTQAVNTLCAYDGRNAGVGRIVTGSTFHHYIDINLGGDSSLTAAGLANVGNDAQTGHGLGDNAAALPAITTVYRNITEWLARPTPGLQLILERSTFSKDEATASSTFDHAILVTVDGLKASQFPAGGIPALGAVAAGPTPAWAPQVAAPDPSAIRIDLTSVDSDDHTLSPILHRFTFTYRVNFLNVASAFGFVGMVEPLPVIASLTSPAVAAPLTDTADIELVKSANPFMLDLDNNNTTAWLSSDVKVFPVVAGGAPKLGHSLAAGASSTDALSFLQTMLGSLTINAFENLDPGEESSALSPFPTTTGMPTLNVYNFALARVRVAKHAAIASNVRVGFRIVPSPTTASLTFQTMGSTPIGSYMQTAAADPIPLPGQDGGGSQWLSFPFFATARVVPPGGQTDDNTKKDLPINMGGEQSFFYGALIDNNLMGPAYVTQTPTSGGMLHPLSDFLMGEHQCLVAQVMYSGAPIVNGANPATSDKLSQRNLAFSAVANPGLDASRMALHTFEIEATPTASAGLRPDELLLQWTVEPPERTSVDIFIPTWNAQDVVDLADRLYPRHEITVVDAQTISIPGGGTRYVPIPPSNQRQTGVVSAQFPLGVVKGLRFDLSVRQISTRRRAVDPVAPKTTKISLEEAANLIDRLDAGTKPKAAKGAKAPRGVFALGDNKVLITDLRVVDDFGDHALVVEHVSAQKATAAMRAAGEWRVTIGAFQLAVPVSDKASMLPHHLRLLSVMRWRAEQLPQRPGRWNKTFLRYVEMLAEKVRALGGDPYAVPPTPDGSWPGLYAPVGTGGGGLVPGAGLGHGGVETGKIASLLYDHFGDFDGFVLEEVSGHLRRYLSHEERIEHLVREAWLERFVVTVWAEHGEPAKVRELAFGRPT